MSLADPDQLEELAAQLERQAVLVREHHGAFAQRVAQVAWQSDGAEDYRTTCAKLRADLERNAVELEDAADLLRTHATRVRERIEWMNDMVDKLRHEAQEAWDDAQGAFEWGKDKADDAWEKVKGWF